MQSGRDQECGSLESVPAVGYDYRFYGSKKMNILLFEQLVIV